MFHDIKHAFECRGLLRTYGAPEMRDCTCGAIIDCLLAERCNLQLENSSLRDKLDTVTKDGKIVIILSNGKIVCCAPEILRRVLTTSYGILGMLEREEGRIFPEIDEKAKELIIDLRSEDMSLI